MGALSSRLQTKGITMILKISDIRTEKFWVQMNIRVK